MGIGDCNHLFWPSCSVCLDLIYVSCSQSLIKKDKEDWNDPEMPQFFSELVTAYMDPALSPSQLSNSIGHTSSTRSDISDDSITPLLSHSVFNV